MRAFSSACRSRSETAQTGLIRACHLGPSVEAELLAQVSVGVTEPSAVQGSRGDPGLRGLKGALLI